MICHGPPWSPFSEITGHLSLRGSFPSSCFSLSLFPLLDFSATILKSVLYQSGLNLTSVGITGSHSMTEHAFGSHPSELRLVVIFIFFLALLDTQFYFHIAPLV